ncbi:MAG: TetR/AcrR family transcriptional regulator [Novosphingobium sp.]
MDSENSGQGRRRAVSRRMGPQNSATSHAILDGAERVLQSRGYGAITSRSVAEESGVKHQLVYYYFKDIDDLLLTAFKRRMDRGIERLQRDAQSDRPVRAIFEDFYNSIDAWLDFEYMALANHHDGVRQEIVRFQTEARAIQIGIIERAYREKGIDPETIPPAALAFLITHVAMALVREEGTGFSAGHDEIRELVDRFFRSLE